MVTISDLFESGGYRKLCRLQQEATSDVAAVYVLETRSRDRCTDDSPVAIKR